MIKAVIIDDELHNRNLLCTMLNNHCPDVDVVGQAADATEGYKVIQQLKPELVFLDVRMPEKSGFDLLRMFDTITFEVIFVSGFDEYALAAFEFNALAYILKPIDYLKLITAVSKAQKKIQANTQNSEMFYFVRSIDVEDCKLNRISVHHNDRVILINISQISSVEGKTDYCRIEMNDKTHYSSSKDLKLFENMLDKTGGFIRISKSVLININQVKSYSKGELCIVELMNGATFEVSRRKKAEIIGYFKTKLN